MTDPQLRQLRIRTMQIFEQADAGHHTLPEPLLAGRQAVLTVESALTGYPPVGPREKVISDIVAATIAAAQAGKPAPDPWPTVRDADAERAAHSLRVEVNKRALVEVLDDLHHLVVDHAQRIIVEHLQPAHAETVAAARDAVDLFGQLGDDPRALLQADKKTQAAYLAAEGIAARYGALRRSREILLRLTGRTPQNDDRDEFGEMRNKSQVWPLWRGQLAERAPWAGQTGQGRLATLVRLGADLWLPTVDEVDEAWMAVHGEAYRQNVHRRQLAGMVNAMGS